MILDFRLFLFFFIFGIFKIKKDPTASYLFIKKFKRINEKILRNNLRFV